MVWPARFGNFLRRIAPALVVGCVTASALPISAQSVSQIRPAPGAAALSSAAQFAEWHGQAGLAAAQISLLTVPATAPKRIEILETGREPSEGKPGWEQMVEFSGTPFTQQVVVPLGSLFSGRIRLGGFNAVTPMEHIERGLPGGGSLDAWSPVPMGHGGMILPKDDNQYGLSLTVHLARDAERQPGEQKSGLLGRLAELNVWLRTI
jgi:hypothetical protein